MLFKHININYMFLYLFLGVIGYEKHMKNICKTYNFVDGND